MRRLGDAHLDAMFEQVAAWQLVFDGMRRRAQLQMCTPSAAWPSMPNPPPYPLPPPPPTQRHDTTRVHQPSLRFSTPPDIDLQVRDEERSAAKVALSAAIDGAKRRFQEQHGLIPVGGADAGGAEDQRRGV
jgi:hypothetical protein